jgi:hypothetical protein
MGRYVPFAVRGSVERRLLPATLLSVSCDMLLLAPIQFVTAMTLLSQRAQQDPNLQPSDSKPGQRKS